MPTATVTSRRKPEAHSRPVPEVPSLVRRLVHAVANSAAASNGSADAVSNGVLLDVVVDGVRCVLVRSHPASARPRVVLSPREREIARMVAKGYPNKTIAAVLDISAWTVCTHLRRIFAKLGVTTRSAMVASLADAGEGWESNPATPHTRAATS